MPLNVNGVSGIVRRNRSVMVRGPRFKKGLDGAG